MGDTRHSSTDSDSSEVQPSSNLALVRRSQIEALAFNTINKLYKHDNIDGLYFIFNKDLAILKHIIPNADIMLTPLFHSACFHVCPRIFMALLGAHHSGSIIPYHISHICTESIKAKNYAILTTLFLFYSDNEEMKNFIFKEVVLLLDFHAIQTLVDHGMPIEQNNNFAAQIAINENRPDLLSNILSIGGSIENLHLHFAVKQRQVELLEVIFNKKHNRATLISNPLLRMAQVSNLQHEDDKRIVMLMIESGVYIHESDNLSDPNIDDFFIRTLGDPGEFIFRWPQQHSAIFPYLIGLYFRHKATVPLDYLQHCPDWHKPYVGRLLVA